jgi:uncharacterized RDD family membrane protein YckC
MENNQGQDNTQNESNQLSEELFELQDNFIDATLGQRFLNWLIDNLLMQYGLGYLTGTLVGYLLAAFFPEYIMRIIERGGENSFDLIFIGYLIAIFNYLIYYTICEKAFKGYTLGKLITGTRAIRTDGSELSFKDAILRTVSRIVPFEALSAFGRKPWHDSWTNTRVIKSR